MTAVSRVPVAPATAVPAGAATEVRVRSRVRAVDTTGAAERPAYEALLVDFVTNNKAKNAANTAAEKAKKALEKAMAQANITSFKQTVDGVEYDVTFLPGETDYVDVKELHSKIDIDVFLKLVTTSQGAVKDECGSNVLAAVLRTKTTDASVKIKATK